MRRELSRILLPTLVLAGMAVRAQAVLTPLGYYRLGEDDAGAANGGTVTTTADIIGAFTDPDRDMTAEQLATPVVYSNDTPSFTPSTLSVRFDANESYLTSPSTPWYTAGGAFRWGAEMFVKPDASMEGVKSVFFQNGNADFNMGINAEGLFYVKNDIFTADTAPGPGITPAKFGDWQHVAFFTTGSFWQLFVDGVAQYTAPRGTTNFGAPGGAASLGGDNLGTLDTSYSGLIDDHRTFTWSGAFNPNELLWYQARGDGDVNEDGDVNAEDYDIWRANVGTDISATTPLQGRALGDLNGDRQINLLDFGIIKDNKTPSDSLGVPEPGSTALVLIGAAALALRRKLRRGWTRVAALACLALCVVGLHANTASAQATATWTGGDGNWTDAKWTDGSGPGGAPGDGDNIVLPVTTGTVVVNGDIASVFGTMNQQGGTLDIQAAGSLQFAGVFENGKAGTPNTPSATNVAGLLVVGNGLNLGRDTIGALRVSNTGSVAVTGAFDAWWAPGATFDIAGTNGDISTTAEFYLGPQTTVNANISSTAFNALKANVVSIQGGTLNVNFINGFAPAFGNSWTIFDGASRTGTITNVAASGLPPGTRLNVGYAAGGTLGQVVTASIASTLNLLVDAASGDVTIQNPIIGATTQTIDGYIIRSASNSLDASAFDGVAQAGWLPGLPPSQNSGVLSESSFSGSLAVAQGATYPLGEIFAGTSAADQDLSFEFRLTNGDILQGTVQYVGTPGLAADFNGVDGVNGADLTIWKGGFGTATGAEKADGDYDLDGDVDGADFMGWQRESGLGTSPVAPGVGAVPEPASMLLLAMAAAGIFASRPFRRD